MSQKICSCICNLIFHVFMWCLYSYSHLDVNWHRTNVCGGAKYYFVFRINKTRLGLQKMYSEVKHFYLHWVHCIWQLLAFIDEDSFQFFTIFKATLDIVLLFQCLANVEAFIDFDEEENIEEDAMKIGICLKAHCLFYVHVLLHHYREQFSVNIIFIGCLWISGMPHPFLNATTSLNLLKL